MKLIASISILILFLFGFSSCKKGKADVTINGTITNTFDGLGLANCSVSLTQVNADGTTELLGQMNSSNGTYSFTISRTHCLGYNLAVVKNNYFNVDEFINFSSITVENDNVNNFSTAPLSWVKLKFQNDFPVPSDKMKITKIAGREGCVDDPFYLDGDADTVIYCENDGGTSFTYNYLEVSGNQFGQKSAVTIPFDTTEILLQY